VFTDRTGARIDQITLSAPEAPPPEPPTVPSTTVPLVPPVPSDSHVGAWLLIGALVTVIVSSAAVLIRRRLGLASSPTPEA